MMMKRMKWENEVEAQSSFRCCLVILVPAIDCTYCEKHCAIGACLKSHERARARKGICEEGRDYREIGQGNGHRWTFCLHFTSYSCDSANYCRFSVML